MSDDTETGQDVLDNVIRDMGEVEDRLELAMIITEAANNRLRIFRDRYYDEDDAEPPEMPPDERDFHEGPGNKDVYSGPPEDRDDDE